jgi:hypothetical protein
MDGVYEGANHAYQTFVVGKQSEVLLAVLSSKSRGYVRNKETFHKVLAKTQWLHGSNIGIVNTKEVAQWELRVFIDFMNLNFDCDAKIGGMTKDDVDIVFKNLNFIVREFQVDTQIAIPVPQSTAFSIKE